MKRPAFTLLLDTRQRVAELMGECPKCGAMTMIDHLTPKPAA